MLTLWGILNVRLFVWHNENEILVLKKSKNTAKIKNAHAIQCKYSLILMYIYDGVNKE